MPGMRTLVSNQDGEPPLRGGHSLCQGCGIPTIVRTVLGSIETPVVVVSATGCLEVSTTRFPHTAWNVPWLHVAFENAAAVISGIESAWRSLQHRGAIGADEPVTFVAFAGDGGTYDIGLQALSGALERGHRFLYVCYDNQAYMNTGVQRSGATPHYARTTTTPTGAESRGKVQERKDIAAIVSAHHADYVAQAAGCRWQDLSDKVVRAAATDGPSFMNVLADCPLGWAHEPRVSARVSNMAVETRFWPLYEIERGEWRLTYRPDRYVPIEEWLKPQGRFRHLMAPDRRQAIEEIQNRVDEDWQALVERCGGDTDA